jgi:hypothetical protein
MIRYQGKIVNPIGLMRETGGAARRLSGLVCMDERSEVGGKAWARSDGLETSFVLEEIILCYQRCLVFSHSECPLA